MKTLICLLLCVGIASGISLPLKPNCATMFCTAVFLTCSDGTPAPVPANGCCPSLSACKGSIAITQPVRPISCAATFCTMDLKMCPDGTPAPIPAGECCPSLKACTSLIASSRSGLLGSLGSNANLLQTLTSATHGTDLGTVLSILNLLNNIQQFTNDVHQIPVLINQTLAGLVSGAGQAGQIIVDQLIGSITNQQNNGRDLLGSLGQNVNLLSSIGHILPQGTSISTVISILNLLNNINALSNDIHQIPVLLNQTLSTLVGGAGEAGQIIVNQLLGLVGVQTQGRDLLGSLGQNVNLLSTVSHLLPQGTSIATVISLLNLLNNVNALNNDLHQIPVVLQETLSNLLNGVQNLLPPTLQPVQGA